MYQYVSVLAVCCPLMLYMLSSLFGMLSPVGVAFHAPSQGNFKRRDD